MALRQEKEYVEMIRAIMHNEDNETVRKPLLGLLEKKGYRPGDVFDALCDDGIINHNKEIK